MSKGNPLNEALRQEVLAVDGVTDVIENRQAVHVRFENEESSSGGMCDLLSDRNRDKMEAALVSGTLPQDSHSIALDMEYAEDMIGVDVGSVIKLTIGDQEIPVTVSGLFINDGLQNGHGPLTLDNTCMVATKELFQEAMPTTLFYTKRNAGQSQRATVSSVSYITIQIYTHCPVQSGYSHPLVYPASTCAGSD